MLLGKTCEGEAFRGKQQETCSQEEALRAKEEHMDNPDGEQTTDDPCQNRGTQGTAAHGGPLLELVRGEALGSEGDPVERKEQQKETVTHMTPASCTAYH